jgi:diguanylate cyclase (GGDEF)-like protein
MRLYVSITTIVGGLHPIMASGSIASSAYFIVGAIIAAVIAIVFALAHAQVQRRLRAKTRDLDNESAERQRAEEALARVRADLEDRVRQRTHALEQRNEELMRLRLALETANQRLRRLVAVDALTGIANRRHFDRALERELRRTRREHQPLSLIFLDLDEFKRFNDTYGHARGDDVLRRVAQTLDETFRRGGDFVARYGGEEFAVVLPGVDGRRASLYAERLRRRIWRLSIPYGASQLTDRVTISGGVATIAANRSASADQVLLVADRALYRAKCLGKNRIVAEAVEPDTLHDSGLIGMAS